MSVTLEPGRLLFEMLRIRRFEEKCAELYSATKIRGFLHLYIGEEAIAVGTIPQLRAEDSIVSTYREHGHALVRGLSSNALMAELFGKREGCSHGRGGSMHLFDSTKNFFGGNAIVAGGLPLAVGLGLATKIKKENSITACFFGDGAVAEGVFHESLNLASLWHLPVLFICENNFYAMGTPIADHLASPNISEKAKNYNIASKKADGMNILEVQSAAREAIEYIKTEMRPYLIEYETYRFRAHSMYDPDLYRSKTEIEDWKKRDPILTYTKTLMDNNTISEKELQALEKEIETELEAAIQFGEQGTWEPIEDLTKDVYSTERKV